MKARKPTWVLVAAKTKAKVFELVNSKSAPVELFEINNPRGYLKEKDLASDKPGRKTQQSSSHRNSLPPHHQKTERVTKMFIELVLAELERQQRKGRFGDLILIAEPRLLGRFRGSLAPHKDLTVTKEIRRDLIKAPEENLPTEIQRHLRA